MNGSLSVFFSQIKVGAKQNHKNMTLYCLLSEHEAPVDFLTLDNALAHDALAISELTEGGSVPELKVLNKSDQNVLLMDGEELVGAKQNRVLNTTILIAPKSETNIPVSCVEQGRWSYRSQHFGSQSRAMSANLRKRKTETVNVNLRRGRNFMSDQGVVWDEIEKKYDRMAARPSPTMAMADLYESHRNQTASYLSAFRPVFNQVGMIVFIDGEVAGIEILHKFLPFRENHSKLVNSYVMDALETSNGETKPNHRSLRGIASKIVESMQLSRIEQRKSVSLGADLRMESERLVGSGLEFEGQVIQLSVFSSGNGNETGPTSKMRRASARRESQGR
jgi:hypothetical protein